MEQCIVSSGDVTSRQERVFVGLDYAMSGVQVCVLDADGRVLSNRKLPNDSVALTRHVSAFGARIEAAIEASTGSADLTDELQSRGWRITQAHPGYVHRIKQSPDKSDFGDARLLADLTRVGYLPRVWLAPQAVRELRRLTRYRQSLVDRRRAVKLQVSALLRDHRVAQPPGCAWTRRWRRWLSTLELPTWTRLVIDEHCVEIDQLKTRIERVELAMLEATRTDPMTLALQTYRGIGLVTACVMRAEIGDVTRFHTGKQLSRFCGLTPRNASSGERQADAGLIRAGNRYLRSTLIEAAHRLKRYDTHWQDFAGRMAARGKKTCVIVTAVANRWMRRLFHHLPRPAA